jgi:hypothetical protein
VGDKPTPLPAGNPFDQALAQAGIKLRWLGGYDTADGIVAPQLEITAQGQMPGLPAPSVLTVRLGYATAAVQAGRATSGSFDINVPAGSPSPEVPQSEPPPVTTVTPEAPPAAVISVSYAPVPDVSIAGQPLNFAAASPGPGPEANASVGSSETAAPPPAATGEVRLRAGPSKAMAVRRASTVVGSAASDSGRTLYLLLGAGALVALLAVPLFRLLTMRLGGHA